MKLTGKSAWCSSNACPDPRARSKGASQNSEDGFVTSLRPHARHRTAYRRRNRISPGSIETLSGNSTPSVEKTRHAARENCCASILRAFDAHPHQLRHGRVAAGSRPDESTSRVVQPEERRIAARHRAHTRRDETRLYRNTT